MKTKSEVNFSNISSVAVVPMIAYIAGIIIAVGCGIFFCWGQYEANLTLRNCIAAGGNGWIESSWGSLYKVTCIRR